MIFFIWMHEVYPYRAMKLYLGHSLKFSNHKLPGNYEYEKNKDGYVDITVDIPNIQARFIKIRLKKIMDDFTQKGKGKGAID